MDVIIEIPFGENVKYELENGTLRCDRILNTSMVYPGNYGYLPDTLGKDGDALDILLVNSEKLYPTTKIKSTIIGALEMEDEAGIDHKLIAIPHESVSPHFDHIKNINHLQPTLLDKIKHFFQHYKDNDSKKWSKVGNFINKEKAFDIVKEGIELFKNK